MNDITPTRTLVPSGVARVLVLAADDLFHDESAKKKLMDLSEWLEESSMALRHNDKPNASSWILGIAEAIDTILEKRS